MTVLSIIASVLFGINFSPPVNAAGAAPFAYGADIGWLQQMEAMDIFSRIAVVCKKIYLRS